MQSVPGKRSASWAPCRYGTKVSLPRMAPSRPSSRLLSLKRRVTVLELEIILSREVFTEGSPTSWLTSRSASLQNAPSTAPSSTTYPSE